MLWLLPLLASLAQSPAAAPPGSGPLRDPMTCGARCLRVALLALTERPPGLGALQQELGPPGPRGVDLARLGQAAERRGLHTLAVSTSLENLRARPERFACIAQIQDRTHAHFVLLYDVDDEQVDLIDPPRKLRVPIPTFQQSWTGRALLIGREGFLPEEAIVPPRSRWPLLALVGVGVAVLVGLALASRRVRSALGRSAPTSLLALLSIAAGAGAAGCRQDPGGVDIPMGGALAVSPSIIDLGEQPLGGPARSIRAVATIRNASRTPIRIHELLSSCGCATATLQNDTVPAGGGTILTAWVNPGLTEGPRAARVALRVEGIATDLALELRWTCVGVLRVEPEPLANLELRPHESREATTRVWSSRIAEPFTGGRVEVVSDSRAVSAVWEPAEGASGGGPPSSGAAEADHLAGELKVRIQAPGEAGAQRARLYLRAFRGAKEWGRAEAAVSWSVSPLLVATPSRIWIGTVSPGATVQARVRLRAASHEPFAVLGVDSTPPALLRAYEIIEAEDPAGRVLALDLAPPAPSGAFRGRLLVRTDLPGAEVIEVPASGLLGESAAVSEP